MELKWCSDFNRPGNSDRHSGDSDRHSGDSQRYDMPGSCYSFQCVCARVCHIYIERERKREGEDGSKHNQLH